MYLASKHIFQYNYALKGFSHCRYILYIFITMSSLNVRTDPHAIIMADIIAISDYYYILIV